MSNYLTQEIYCHNCRSYVTFKMDMGLNGNHVIICPKCKHEHCRVVKDGEITSDRWDSRNNTFYVSIVVYKSTYTFSQSSYLATSWLGTTGGN